MHQLLRVPCSYLNFTKFPNSPEYQEELKVLEKTVSDLEVLKQSRGAKQPLNKKQWISYNQQVSQDRSKMEKRRLERLEYLLTTVRNYVCSLKLNSSSLENDLLVFRCGRLFKSANFLPP